MVDMWLPDAVELDAFELWLRRVQHVDPTVMYPDISMSYVYDLYRPAYARSILVDAMRSPIIFDEAWTMLHVARICPSLDVAGIIAEVHGG